MKPSRAVPFNRPRLSGQELEFIQQAVANRHLAGNGMFTRRCQEWLQKRVGCSRALLTHSCTAALEMAAILADIGPGDEVILPSFTFVSTANAFVLRGATPVFVDIRPDTLNMDERQIAAAITPRTRAIVPVHYAGVACGMSEILEIAERHGLLVIEDAAQGLLCSLRDRPLGSIGHLAALSFHETKNVTSGEGGALLVNDPRFCERAEIIWQKGTNRQRFLRGETDRYTWMDIGSSYTPSEVTAAFLFAQLHDADAITERRCRLWHEYHRAFEPLEHAGALRRPVVPEGCVHNGHLYYLLMPDVAGRDAALRQLGAAGIQALFHYVPLHSSPAGRRYGRPSGDLPVTTRAADCLLRLPLWADMGSDDIASVIAAVRGVSAGSASV